jgi:three-Cys-motif partner protein
MEPVPEQAAPASIAHSRMSELPFKFDEIGIWSELKLEIIEQYGAAYTKAFARTPNLKKYYIDAFSGAGRHVAKKTKAEIEGSPARALKVRPPFDGYCFIDLNEKKTDFLRSICGDRQDVEIHTGDANEYLTKVVLPKIQYNKFTRALCLLDPYGLHLNWEVILQAGQSQAVDMFLNFPVMDINRNAIWRQPEKVPQQEDIERMNKFWGDDSWRDVAYAESQQQDLFSPPDKIKQSNDAIAAAFRERLRKVAGFQFVPEPLPMRNSKKNVIYYLFLASPKAVAQKIISDIFDKHR